MQEAVILLVEGKSAGPQSVRQALIKAGFEVILTHTGSEARRLLDSGISPDLVVFDASHMRSSGSRSSRRIRDMLADTPIIHCRAAGESEDRTAAADLYMARPFTGRKLLNRVRALLPVDDQSEEIIRFGDIVLYRSKRSVEVAGQGESRLTPKLAHLLEEFIRHPNQVVSRRQLMEHVWNTTYIGDTRTLDVHIRWIRECIEVNPARPRILRTVRGKGYIFNIPEKK